MDLQYSAEEKAFRAEVRAFIAEHLSSEIREGMLRGWRELRGAVAPLRPRP